MPPNFYFLKTIDGRKSHLIVNNTHAHDSISRKTIQPTEFHYVYYNLNTKCSSFVNKMVLPNFELPFNNMLNDKHNLIGYIIKPVRVDEEKEKQKKTTTKIVPLCC